MNVGEHITYLSLGSSLLVLMVCILSWYADSKKYNNDTLSDDFADYCFCAHSNTTWITRHVVSGSYCVKSEKDCGNGAVQFGRYIPSFTPLGSQKDFTIISREISTVCLSPKLTLPQLSYTLITANSPDCGPPSAPIHLQYRVDNHNWTTLYPRKTETSVVLWFLLLWCCNN